MDSNHVVLSECSLKQKSPSRKGEDNTPGRCFSMLIFAVAPLCCFVVCNYACSKMFVMIWKYIKADKCPPSLTYHNVTARVSCPCFVDSEQYVALRQGVQPHQPLDEEIHPHQHPSVLLPHHRCTILCKKYSDLHCQRAKMLLVIDLLCSLLFKTEYNLFFKIYFTLFPVISTLLSVFILPLPMTHAL